jgi:tetratricopeptide (TPR) repeat protein
MKFAFLVFLLLAAPAPAKAASTEDIFALYAQGDYEQAAQAGQASHSAPGLAIAARAVLADEVLRDSPCLSCLERAESLARAAIAADPHFAYGHIWLAVALGYEARVVGTVRARLKDLPNQSKEALDAANAEDPKNAYAVSALGGWHIEIVRGGGATLARVLYDASESQALALFDRAVKLAPDNVAVHYQIALALAGFDADKYRPRVVGELKMATSNMARTAYEKKIQGRASELLNLMDDPNGFEAKLTRYQGFP